MQVVGKRLVGILGGTFNPIHNGHLHLAEQLINQLHFDEVRFIPSAVPALKHMPQVSARARAEMVNLAIAHHPKFTLDTRELQRTGVSYTIDTLQSLRAELGIETAICLLMGYDAFLGLPRWHRWQSLLDYAHIVVVNRPQVHATPAPALAEWLTLHQTHALEAIHHAPSGAVFFVEIPPLDISSSTIRQSLLQGDPVNKALPPSVLAYIEAHHLYQSPE